MTVKKVKPPAMIAQNKRLKKQLEAAAELRAIQTSEMLKYKQRLHDVVASQCAEIRNLKDKLIADTMRIEELTNQVSVQHAELANRGITALAVRSANDGWSKERNRAEALQNLVDQHKMTIMFRESDIAWLSKPWWKRAWIRSARRANRG